MYLIRVTGKDRQADNDTETQFSKLDFSFNELLLAIGAYLTDLYWAHTGLIYSFPESLTKEEYDIINAGIREYTLHSEPNSRIEYMHRGFIEKFGRYIYSESVDLAGYEDIESLKSFETYLDDISNSKSYVHFKCEGAASWEVYTKNLNIIKLVEEAFMFTETIGTGD